MKLKAISAVLVLAVAAVGGYLRLMLFFTVSSIVVEMQRLK